MGDDDGWASQPVHADPPAKIILISMSRQIQDQGKSERTNTEQVPIVFYMRRHQIQ